MPTPIRSRCRSTSCLCGATQLSVVPTGDLWITGLQGESLHVRKLLDMIGAKPDFLTCGAYKSAAELFMRDTPSNEADEMHNWLLDSLYDTSVKPIARGRGVSPEKVRQWIDDGPYTATKARDAGLIDAVQHRQEFEAGVKQRFDGNVKLDTKYGQKAQKAIDLSSPLGILNFYAELLSGGKKAVSHKDSIAIVYVEGPIVLGAHTLQPARLGEAADGGQHAHSQCPQQGRRGRLDQGRRAAREFTRRLGRRQRDHSRRHQAREGQKAARRFDGRRRRQRRLLRRLRCRHDLCRRRNDHRLDRRGRRQAGHQGDVEQGRHYLEGIQPRCECRAARVPQTPSPPQSGRSCKAGWTTSTASSRGTSPPSAAAS